MTERPILFSAPMIRALLADTKTQTRRVVKMRSHHQIEQRDDGQNWPWMYDSERNADWWMPCPHGQPGDRLWVRETWRVCGGREYEYQQDRTSVMYRATHQESGFPLTWESYKWRPSIFMPRWASRITLEIAGVRVERLQEISEADAIAEGIPSGDVSPPDMARFAYRQLWESINGHGSWDANPWVWVIEFKRVTP